MLALRQVCRCALSEGVPRRSLVVALIVGTILNLINQGDAGLGGTHYGAVSFQMREATKCPS